MTRLFPQSVFLTMPIGQGCVVLSVEAKTFTNIFLDLIFATYVDCFEHGEEGRDDLSKFVGKRK